MCTYRCHDGRPFPVSWRNEEEANATWTWDPEHNPAPATPMDAATWQDCGPGSARAREECGFPAADAVVGSGANRYLNGFSYSRSLPRKLSDRRRARAAYKRLRQEHANASVFWDQWCVPRVAAVFEELRTGGMRPVRELLDRFGYGFEQTFLVFGVEEDLRGFLPARFGADGERLALELTSGQPTATLEADQALWSLAREAAAHPGLRRALLAGEDAGAVAPAEGGESLVSGIQRYLDEYGWRTMDWDVSSPMLRERPEAVLQVIRRTIADGLPSPAERSVAAARRRELLALNVRAHFAGDTTGLAEFDRLFEATTRYLGIKEGRAHWQLSLCGALRHALLEKGARLVAHGVAAGADDVFYLLPAEVDTALAAVTGPSSTAGTPAAEAWDADGLGERIAFRRSERARWLGVVPPARLSPGDLALDLAPAEGGELRGIGVSRGTATGRARVLASFDEYERVGPGDVLVCTTTTPAWTPLFAVVSAVVADGDAYSHTAIAAREYGIPAVVGIRAATVRISEGQMVTVDGDRGLVRIEA